MEKLLTDVQARLISEVPALKYVDEDWGQLDFYSERPPVKFPCGLVDATQAVWSNTGKLVQMGMVQVTIRVADYKLSNTSAAAPQTQKDKAFAIFDTLEAIHKALHGWSGDASYSHLIRTSNKRVKRQDGIRLYEIVYTTELKDASAAPEAATQALNMKVTVTRQA